MRKIIVLILLIIFGIMGKSQVNDTIFLSFSKTAFLIFSNSITDVVVGSEQVLVQEKENKIILQAAQEGFEETNLMVQTGNRYYMFIIKYSDSPKKYLYNYQDSKENSIVKNNTATVVVDKMAEEKDKEKKMKKDSLNHLFAKNCQKVASASQEFFDLAETKGGVSLVLTNMYVDDDLFYFRVDLINGSKIRYDIDFYQFTIRNKKKVLKKTPIQDEVITPYYVANDVKVIEAKNKNSFVFVLPKFTIQDKKKLFIEFWESKGDRNFTVSITNKELLKLNQLKK